MSEPCIYELPHFLEPACGLGIGWDWVPSGRFTRWLLIGEERRGEGGGEVLLSLHLSYHTGLETYEVVALFKERICTNQISCSCYAAFSCNKTNMAIPKNLLATTKIISLSTCVSCQSLSFKPCSINIFTEHKCLLFQLQCPHQY